MTGQAPKKIAILGGGLGGLSTAYYLSSQPDWKSRFSITVYQLGHRLGGKCASSRGPFDRIEEHGIHGLLGSYYNALPMMADVYAELARKPGEPLATFDEAFVGSNFSMMWEFVDGALRPWPSRTAPNDWSPKDLSKYKGLPGHLTAAAKGCLGVAAMASKAAPGIALFADMVAAFEKVVAALAARPPSEGPKHPAVGLIDGLRAPLVAALAASPPTEIRRALMVVDFMMAMVRGCLFDNVAVNGFDSLDAQDWADWMNRHGVTDATFRSPLVRTTVNICYQNDWGDTSRRPRMSAGAYVAWTLKSFDYMGSNLWSFGAGTGETVIAPLYQILQRRGVRFEFFQKVEALHLDASETRLESIDITVQATLKNPAAGYQPLIYPKGLPSWPKLPDYDQLNEGAALRHGGYDLESYWSGWPDAAHAKLRNQRALKSGVDFDVAVLAMYPGANGLATPFQRVKSSTAVAEAWASATPPNLGLLTQAVQVWLDRDVAALGFPEPLDESKNEVACSATYFGPANGNEEFHHLLQWESWPEGKGSPKAIWYFCGLMPNYELVPAYSDTEYPKRQLARVQAQFTQYFQSCIQPLWPKATAQALQGAGDPFSLDFGVLVDPHTLTSLQAKRGPIVQNLGGAAGLQGQFLRANIDPTELYIPTPPGSVSKRLNAWGSGFSNLVLAGDWIYTGVNVGSFEGTVCSGKLASHAICGAPSLESVIGYPADKRPAPPPLFPQTPTTGRR